MIKSIASLSKDNVPSLMTNNALYYLSNNKWLLLSTDNVVKVEFDQDSNVWDSECITFRGKNVGLLQYLELKDLQVVVLGLDNDITISDLNNVHLFHTSLDSEMASCAFIQSDSNNDPQIFIGTTLGRILRINEKDSDWKLNEEFRIDTNIWTIGQFKDFLVLSLESGTLEFWKNTGSWDRVAVNESKYPSTCMCVLETEYLVVTRLHGNIDILNSDLTTLISVGAHTGYISGIAFSSNRVIMFC